VKIQLPFFKGFLEYYVFRTESLYNEYHANEEEYQEQYGDIATEENIEYDDQRYMSDVCNRFIDRFKELLETIYPGFIKEMNFDELDSPYFYQYNTDKLYVDVEFCDDWRRKMLEFMSDNKKWLTEKIAADWTSRSGFTSHMSNEYEVWFDEMQYDDADLRIIGVMLGYMAQKSNPEFREKVNKVYDEVSLSDYVKFVN